MNTYNIHNKWNKLKTVMLGDNYRSGFFQDIKNTRIRSALHRIADETQEDLENYETVLKEFGCKVLRPELDHNDSIMNYINQDGTVIGSSGVPRSPLQPRDSQFVVGNKMYLMGGESKIVTSLEKYNKDDIIQLAGLVGREEHAANRHWTEEHFKELAGAGWGSYNQYKNDPDYFKNLSDAIFYEIEDYSKDHYLPHHVPPPSCTLVGRDLYIDQFDFSLIQRQIDLLCQHNHNLRLNTLHHGGHSDGCFHTIKPGAILSISNIQHYENTFPGWDVCYLKGESWAKVDGFLKLKQKVSGKWWVPGEEENDEFTHFVESWLQDWVGFAEESVFDVNVLVLDEHHVCVNTMNPIVTDFLKKHNMEPVHVPWRHRYFWDGGLHCITLDLEREGSQENYFPDRAEQGIIDYGFPD